MTNMSQFSYEMDEINFVESSSIFDEADISTNFSICENEGGPENIVKPKSPVVGTLGTSQQTKHSGQTVSLDTGISGSSQQPKPRLMRTLLILENIFFLFARYAHVLKALLEYTCAILLCKLCSERIQKQ